jgi:SAM-dependent methyltransferase
MTAPPAGLCDDCQHARRIGSARGSVFLLCGMHERDPRFAKYPRLPVLRCPAHQSVRRSYDAAAEGYAAQFFHELDDKPRDRELLDAFAAEVRGKGRVVDLGCGPGHVARYLHERGVDATGIDLSPGLVAVAGRMSPQVPFETGTMLALAAPDASLAGIVAFYAVVNLTRDEVVRAFAEMRRVLRPAAPLLLAFHVGDETVHVDELCGARVSLDFRFFPRAFIEPALEAAGMKVEAWMERAPYEAEHPSTRAYVTARRI